MNANATNARGIAKVASRMYDVSTSKGGPVSGLGIRELKSGLSKFLKRVALGERITVTERGRPIALLIPVDDPSFAPLRAMIATGAGRWVGGEPLGSPRPARLRSGPPVAQTFAEDRG